MKKQQPKVTVGFNPVNPEPVEVLARSIIEIAAGMKVLDESKLTRKAIIVLIQARTGLTKRQIADVLDNLQQIDQIWLKSTP